MSTLFTILFWTFACATAISGFSYLYFQQEENAIRPGQVWVEICDNPFNQPAVPREKTVMDVRDGYVRFSIRSDTSTSIFSQSEFWFRKEGVKIK